MDYGQLRTELRAKRRNCEMFFGQRSAGCEGCHYPATGLQVERDCLRMTILESGVHFEL
jgi:hypothetical protein